MTTAIRNRPEALSVPEMLRIMDVATALRQDRELVEEQLNLDALKDKLRAKMIAAAQVTGEDVTAEEVDAAIDQYYARLHSFHEPPMSTALALAHVYVRRWAIAKWGGGGLAALLAVWFLFLSPSGPLTITGRTHREVVRLAADVDRRLEALKTGAAAGEVDTLARRAADFTKAENLAKLRELISQIDAVEKRNAEIGALMTAVGKSAEQIMAISQDDAVAPEVKRLSAEALTYVRQRDATRLGGVLETLQRLESRLEEEYTVSVIPAPGGRSAFTRLMPRDADGRKISGYYLIVQAKKADGSVLGRRVHNAETGRDRDLTTWAERVPKEVFDRLGRDKKQDGILNETTFAVKKRGQTDERVVMPGGDGKPLTRLGQVTDW